MSWFGPLEITQLVLCPPGTFINGLVAVVIISKRELWTYANVILAVDTSLGAFYNLVVLPMQTAVDWYHFRPICSVVMAGVVSVFVPLFWLECGIAVERAIFVFKPLRYHQLITSKRVTVFIVVILLYFVLVTTAIFFVPDPDSQKVLGPAYQDMILFGNFSAEDVAFMKCGSKPFLIRGYIPFMLFANCVPAACISVVLFSAILFTARRLARTVPFFMKAIAGNHQPHLSGKNGHTVAVLLACNIIRATLWIPPLVYITVKLNLFGETFNLDYWFEESFYVTITAFSQLSTIIGPLVFAVMQRDFRRSLRTLFCHCEKKQNTEQVTT